MTATTQTAKPTAGTADTDRTVVEQVIERLDAMLAVLQLAHRDAIERAAAELRADEINDAILEICADEWVGAGEIKQRVRTAVASASDKAVQRRLAQLVARRAIQRRGAAQTTAYRSLGLV